MPPKKQNGENVEKTINRTRKVSKSDPNRPSYGDMIKAAISDHKNRKGSSRSSILKYITETYNIPKASFSQTNVQLRHALKRGVESGALKQVSGTGASGSFKLGDGTGSVEKKTKKATKKLPIARMSVGHSTKPKKIAIMSAPKKRPATMSAGRNAPTKKSPAADKKPQTAAVAGTRTSARAAKTTK